MSKAKPRLATPAVAKQDLVILAADNDTAEAMKGLLERKDSLQIRAVSVEIIVHPLHDPGCYHESTRLLALYQRTHSRALVVFDREGSGQEQLSQKQLEAAVTDQLKQAGWEDRAAVVVIDPELENWVWSRSPHVATSLGWQPKIGIREWLVSAGFLEDPSQVKPTRPKEAMEAVLRKVRKPRSSTIYREIAKTVSLGPCSDSAFLKCRQTLQDWFPQTS